MKIIQKKQIKILLSIVFIVFILLHIYAFFPLFIHKDLDENIGSIIIYDKTGKILTDKSKPNGYYKKLKSQENLLNTELVKNLIKIEDKSFLNNFGISFFSKMRALKNNFLGDKIISGGSTITEQLLKNKYFLSHKRTYLQKARESILAFYFSLKYSKNEIMNMYLDKIYFGNRIYGLSGAMEAYFQKEKIEKLTPEEITLLISLINNPGVKQLKEKHFKLYFEKTKQKLGYSFINKIKKLNSKKNIDYFPILTNRVINNFKSDTLQIIDKNKINTKSPDKILIHTNIDKELQNYSKETLNNILKGLKDKNVTNGAVLMINPQNNKTIIYLGSRGEKSNMTDGEVDVIKSLRQPGSTLKPFLYYQALQLGANIDEFIVDIQNEYNSFQKNKVYITQNYSLREYGIVRLKKALGNSLNNATVRLAREIGLEKVYDFYKKSGIKLNNSAEHYGYSLVLGNPSITLENLILSYKTFLPIGENENKFLIHNILSNPDNRDISFGVKSILNTSLPVAVKTGTSSEFRDNLVVSYTDKNITGIWIGNNDNSSMIGVTGITGAGYLWHKIIEKAIKKGYITRAKIKIPKGLNRYKYCLDKNCFRIEMSYTKKNKIYKSAIIDDKYNLKDMLKINNSTYNLSDYEKKRLKELGVRFSP